MPYFKIYDAGCHPHYSGFGEWCRFEAEEIPELEGEYPSKEAALDAWVSEACRGDFDVQPNDEVNGRLHRQDGGSVYTLTHTRCEPQVYCVWADEVDCPED